MWKLIHQMSDTELMEARDCVIPGTHMAIEIRDEILRRHEVPNDEEIGARVDGPETDRGGLIGQQPY